MTKSEPIKCVANDYQTSPFFLVQFNGGNKRFVASFQDKVKIQSFITDFIEQTKTDLQVKIRDLDDNENPKEFDGEVTKSQLLSLIDQYEALIFHDGFHELMIRRPSTGDYIAFDEHGLIFIYTKEDYSLPLVDYGLDYKSNQPLIYEFNHWHIRPATAREDLKRLIIELGLN